MVIVGNGVQTGGGWTDVDRGRWWVIRWVISVTGCSFPSPSSSPIRHQFIPNCPTPGIGKVYIDENGRGRVVSFALGLIAMSILGISSG